MIINSGNGKGTIFDKLKKEYRTYTKEIKKDLTDEMSDIFSILSSIGKNSSQKTLMGQIKDMIGHDDEDSLKDFFDGLSDDSLPNFINSLSEAERSTITVEEAMKRMSTETVTVTEKVKKSSTAFKTFVSIGKAFASTLGNIAITMAVTKGIELLIGYIDDVYVSTAELIEKGKEAQQVIEDIKGGLKDRETFIDSSAKKFGQLREGVNAVTNENISLTNDEYEEYLSLCNQIADIYPELVVGYDEQGTAILNLSSAANEATASLQEMLEVDQQVAGVQIAKNVQAVHEGIIAEIEKLEKEKKDLKTKSGYLESDIASSSNEGLLEQVEKIRSGETNSIFANGESIAAISDILEAKGIEDYFLDANTFEFRFEEEALVDRSNLASILEGAIVEVGETAVSVLTTDRAQNLFEQSLIDSQIESKWQQDLQNFIDGAGGNVNYSNLNENLQNGINEAISRMDYNNFLNGNGEFVMPENYVDMNEYISDEFIDPIAYAFADLGTDNVAIKTAQENAQKALTELFSIDKAKINVDEYAKQIDELMSQIWPLFSKIYGENAESEFDSFSLKFGFKVEDEYGNIVDINKKRRYDLVSMAEQNAEDLTNINEQLDSLTVEQTIELETRYTDPSNGESLKEIIDQIVNKANSIIETEPITFESLFKDEEGTLNTTVDNFQSATSSIQSALDSLAAGEKVDLTDLIQEFPELAGQAKNLEEALNNLKLDKLKDFAAQWKIIVSELEGEELENANNFFKSVIDSINLSDFDISNVSSLIYDMLVPATDDLNAEKAAIKRAENVIEAFANEIKTSEDLEVLLKILADPENAYSTIDEIRTEFEQTRLETKAYVSWDEETPGLDAYSKAKSEANSGDRYLEMITALEEAQTAYENGLIGTDDFKSVAAMISPNGMDDASNWVENYENIKKYFTEDSSGLIEFLKDIESHGLGTFNEETGDATLHLEDMDQAAKDLGMSYETLTAILGRLGDYGFTNDFFASETEGRDHLSDLYLELGEAEAKLQELQENRSTDTTITDTVITAQENRISQIKQSISDTESMLQQLAQKSTEDMEAETRSNATAVLTAYEEAMKSEDVWTQQATIGKLMDSEEYAHLNLKWEQDEQGLWHLAEESLLRLQEYVDSHAIDGPKFEFTEEEQPIADLINSAMEDENSELYDLIETIRNQGLSFEELISGITFDDGLTAEGNLGEAELAIDGILKSLQLSQAEGELLIRVLSKLGYLDINPDISETKETVDEITQPETKNLEVEANTSEAQEKIDQIEKPIEKIIKLRAKKDPILTSFDNSDLSTETAISEKLSIKKLQQSEITESYQEPQIPSIKLEVDSTEVDIAKQALSDLKDACSDSPNLDISIKGVEDIVNITEEVKNISDNSNVEINVKKGTDESPVVSYALSHLENDFKRVNENLINVKMGKDEVSDKIPPIVEKVLDLPDGTVDVEVDDSELNTEIPLIEDVILNIPDGETTITADDQATDVIDYAIDHLDQFDRSSANPPINIIDYATDDINRISNLLDDLDGKSGTITFHTQITGNNGESETNGRTGEFFTGTMLSPAHASGTAYNMLNLRPAYANGDVALSKDEEALVNELGTESIIRDGIWSLLPGGMHVESLKKGDIILNAKQTRDLLRSGKAMGHAKPYGSAYANGTAFNGMSAYAITRGTDAAGNSRGGVKIINTSDSSSTNANTSALKDATDAQKENTEAIEDFQKWAGGLKDWVEVRLQRRQEAIDFQLAESENEIGYIDKNKDVSDAQDITKKLIKDTRKGEKEYLATADEVKRRAIKGGLVNKKQANDLIKKIQKGTIDVEFFDSEKDAKVLEFIDQYSTWWDKIVQCRQSNEELKKSLEDLSQQKLDNIVNRYDGIISHFEDRLEGLDNDIALAEAKGYVDSTKYYDAKIQTTEGQMVKKAAEIKALEESLALDIANGIITPPGENSRGDEAWYEMQGLINDTKLEYEQLEISAQEYLNTQREINWAHEDAKQANMQRLNDEADFYKQLMQEEDEDKYDEKGHVTEYGKAMYGLEAVSYNVNMRDAAEYGERMKKLQEEMALHENAGNQKLIDEYNRLEEAQRASILAAQDNKQAMVDLVKEGIEAQLNALKKLSDEYMEAIQSQKDLYDYSNTVQEQADEVAKLQKRLAAYAGDDSEAGRLKRQETEQALKEAQKQLEETQYDKFIKDQQELLDDLYTQYEDVLNDRLDDIDKLISKVVEGVNGEEGSIQKTIEEQAASVGTTLSEEFKKIFNTKDGQDAVDDTSGNNPNTGVNSAANDKEQEVEDRKNLADQNAQNNINQTNNDYPTTDDEGVHDSPEGYRNDVATILRANGTAHSGPVTEEERKKHSDLWTYLVENYGYTPGSGGTAMLANILGIGDQVKGDISDAEKDLVLKKLIELTGDEGAEDTFRAQFEAIIAKGTARDKKATKDEKKKKSELWVRLVDKYNVEPKAGMMYELGKLFGVKDVKNPPTDKQKDEILKKMKARGYASGTRSTDDEWAWINEKGQEMLTLPNGSIFMPFAKGTGVINNAKTEQVLKLADNSDVILDMVNARNQKLDAMRAAMNARTEANIMSSAVADAANNAGNSGNGDVTVENHITIHVNGVSNMGEFLTELQHSGEFEKLVTSMTAERINGKSKLSKFKHNFS